MTLRKWKRTHLHAQYTSNYRVRYCNRDEIHEANSQINLLVIICIYVTNAFLQTVKSKWLIIYKPQAEFFAAYPQFLNHAWRKSIQLYGKVETGLYRHKNIFPCLLENIPDLRSMIHLSSSAQHR